LGSQIGANGYGRQCGAGTPRQKVQKLCRPSLFEGRISEPLRQDIRSRRFRSLNVRAVGKRRGRLSASAAAFAWSRVVGQELSVDFVISFDAALEVEPVERAGTALVAIA